jgi:hypothetical protein
LSGTLRDVTLVRIDRRYIAAADGRQTRNSQAVAIVFA